MGTADPQFLARVRGERMMPLAEFGAISGYGERRRGGTRSAPCSAEVLR